MVHCSIGKHVTTNSVFIVAFFRSSVSCNKIIILRELDNFWFACFQVGMTLFYYSTADLKTLECVYQLCIYLTVHIVIPVDLIRS